MFLNLDLEGLTPYLENTTYLVLFFIFLTVILFYLISYLAKFFYNSKDKSVERKKPSLNEIIDNDEEKLVMTMILLMF